MILDEATDGLDPEWVARVREIVADWREADPERVLLFASHDLEEVERVANRVVVLQGGRVRETIDVRQGQGPVPSWRLEVEGTESAHLVSSAFPGALPIPGQAHAFRVEAGSARDLSTRLRQLLDRGGLVNSVAPERLSLRERFRGQHGGRKKGGRA
jgi:ABC-type multidrug transport system ATPase subunit